MFRRRWLVLAASMLLLVGSVVGLLNGGKLKDPAHSPVEAGAASDKLTAQLPKTGGSTFDLVFASDHLSVSNPTFKSALQDQLAALRADSRVKAITTPYDAPSAQAREMISTDGQHALVLVEVTEDFDHAQKYYTDLRAEVHAGALQVKATGNLATQHDFDAYLQGDLSRAEFISLPLSLLILVLVFGAVLAAALPIGVGILSIIGGLAGVFLLARVTSVNQYSLNIVTLIGLGVSIDYSLFLVSRFREELDRGLSTEDALSRSMATAGKAITFSGFTVAIGLSGMLFYRGIFLESMGLAGTFAVAAAVIYGLTFLPALLSIIGPRINKWRLPVVGRSRTDGHGFWHALATGVMKRPVMVLVPTVGFIILAGLPFLQIRLANGDITQLPAAAEARQGYEQLVKGFPNQDQNTISVVVDFPSGNPLSADHVAALSALSQRLAAIPGVLRVESVVNLDPKLVTTDYQRLYAQPLAALPATTQEAVHRSVGRTIVVLSALTPDPRGSDGAREIVRTIRSDRVVGDGRLEVTGFTAFDIDFIAFIEQHTPLAVAFVMVVTYIVLFLLLGSVILPLKAVIMNLLSLSASFGALVWIFQEGHLSSLLGFSPTSIDPSVPVLLFCIVFGLSMDYEVLLMSRMKEEFVRTGRNRESVAMGLERSGRLVSGAAAIMVAVFCAFGLAQVVLIKSIGVGMAIAVAIDATVVRALIVPATMRLLGNLNWWAPAPLARLHRRFGMVENTGELAGPAVSPAPTGGGD